jgi:uncharacterized repeat protein (TIGR01451 family)
MSTTRRSRARAALLALATLLSIPVLAPAVRASTVITVNQTAQSINGDSGCSLQEAIYSANLDANLAPDPADPGGIGFVTTGCAAGSGADVIVLPAGAVFLLSAPVNDVDNPLGPTGTPIVYSQISIEGNGARIEHSGTATLRAFAVAGGLEQVAGTGDLTIRELHVKGFLAKGGDGGDGGGGGLGAGGAIYVRGANLTVEGSTFEGNGAQGGNGGSSQQGAGGGGGGLGGNGGRAGGPVEDRFSSGGGGGGGARGNGGSSIVTGPFGQFRGGSQGGGGGGTLRAGQTDDGGPDAGIAGGVLCGGNGGEYSASGADGCQGGGGGGGGKPNSDNNGGVPGAGGYGGGGGGGGYSNSFFTNQATNGGARGGFGGGGGAGGLDASGGDGGFGAGGGGATDSGDAGSGGTFGGRGGWSDGGNSFSITGPGGGGAGLGGAIFSDDGTLEIRNSTFASNVAVRGVAGTGQTGALNGRDAGGAIFAVDGDVTLSNVTITGNETTGANAGLAMYRSTRSGSAASLSLTNTIIAANVTSARECELIGTVAAAGAGNLITNNIDCPGVVSTSDPTLAALAIEAPGVTPTMAIDGTSPAYDAGDDLTCEGFDQRGVSRPRSLHCDIGAYEYVKPSADLSVSTTVVGPVIAGQDVLVIVQLDNNGPTAAQNVSLVDMLPTGTTFVSVVGSGGFACAGTGPVTCTKGLLTEGGSALFTITVHLPASATNGASITNSVSVSSSTPDPVPANNTASVSAMVATRADVSIVKTGPASPIAGTNATYTILVSNHGPSVAAGPSVADTIPAGTTFQSLTSPAGWTCAKPAVGTAGPASVTCTAASLAAGASATFALTLRSTAATPDGSSLCNTASISATTADPRSGNNTSQVCGTVRGVADLSVAASAATSGKPGRGTATFTFVVTNLGPSDAANISFTASSSLFTGPAPTNTAPSGATCTASNQTVTCSWPGIASTGTGQVVISVPWRSAVGKICTTGSVTAGTSDPNAINNTASACIGKK